jgi:hypothetical protein
MEERGARASCICFVVLDQLSGLPVDTTAGRLSEGTKWVHNLVCTETLKPVTSEAYLCDTRRICAIYLGGGFHATAGHRLTGINTVSEGIGDEGVDEDHVRFRGREVS